MAASHSVELLSMGFSVLGGLGIFLLGMKNMSEGLQAIAGDRLRKLIGAVTENRLSACGVGTLVTCLVQSSSVTTVMVVGFISAGFMTLTQGMGVILGANIGTTITGWILVLKIGKYGLPMLGLAAFFFLFSRNDRVRYTGMAIMGVGMVFFGLELMSAGFKPMRTMPEFVAWFGRFQATSYLGVLQCALVGCLLTCIVQSSSATLGITMGLAMNGIIGFPTAAALVLGENIGTTITAILASIGRSTDARRAAYFHTIFNLLGVLWITALFPFYLAVVTKIVGHDPGLVVVEAGAEVYPHIRSGIAVVHSGFNIVNTALFLPFLPLFAKVVTRLVPETAVPVEQHLTYLDARMISSPAMGMQESHRVLLRMGEKTQEMMRLLRQTLTSKERDEPTVQRIFYLERALDVIEKEVTEFVSHILSNQLPSSLIVEARKQLRMANEFESVGDYLEKILKLHLRKQENNIWFSYDGWDGVLNLHDRLEAFLGTVTGALREGRIGILPEIRTDGAAITHHMKQSRASHLERVGTEEASPLASLIFTDMLNAYRRVKDHGINIAEILAGQK
ncbi:MAG: Na/Pi cotransporter family protein [Deferrisomatales bacterium]|nr:Na/Pi cotransporter family protein [Deferrisomatales bacterium]